MKRLLIIIALCWTFTLPTFGQCLPATTTGEICGNGIDDDGDCLIDCVDGTECGSTTFCDGSYIGVDVDCKPPVLPSNKFTMEVDWISPNETTNHYNRVSIGDLDRDGIPEVVTANVVTGFIYILDGANGKVKFDPVTNKFLARKVGFTLERDIVIGNIDDDGCGEIFTYGDNGGKWSIYAYDCHLNLLWSTPAGSEPSADPVFLSLANFDGWTGDKKVELYYRDEIVDAHTGIRIVKGQNSNYVASPIAVDMRGNKTLELASGCSIYSVNLGARTKDAGSLTLLDSYKGYRVRGKFTSATSIADYNQDDVLDILATGSDFTVDPFSTCSNNINDITCNVDQNTTIFFWDGKTGAIKKYIDAFSANVDVFDCKGGVPGAASTGTFYKYGWRNGAGRINIADIDGDGKLNAVFVSGKNLYALDENLSATVTWKQPVFEETSGYTGCTLFDFNGDGKSEVVYRDEKNLYIIDGVTGIPSATVACVSRTNREYPVVADVDADGSTEICVTCASNDGLSAIDFCNNGTGGNQQYSEVRAYKSKTEPWVPARRVWNQHGYFNVNVNDDLSIPLQQQQSHIKLSTGACRPGDPIRDIRPLNSFLNQSPFLNADGCPIYVAADINFDPNPTYALDVIEPRCPDKDFIVNFGIINNGEASINTDLPVSFYKGDPNVAGSIKLKTAMVKLANFGEGKTLPVSITVTGDGSAFQLFIVLNDLGKTSPPIVFPNNSAILECNYNNTKSIAVNPIPVTIQTSATDNLKCVNTTILPNGSVSGKIVNTLGVDISNQFNFYWTNAATPLPIPADYVGATYTGLVDQTYSVFAVHKTAGCGSNSPTQAVGLNNFNFTASISDATLFTNCKVPNGALRVTTNVGVVNDFSYEWYLGATPGNSSVLNVSDVATGLVPNSYSVIVTHKATGCADSPNRPVADNSVKPVPTIVPEDISCSGVGGRITSDVTGNTSNYKFFWYNGPAIKPTADILVANYDPAPKGDYTLVVEHKTTGCASLPQTVSVNQMVKPVLTAPTITHLTTCATTPNGAVSVGMVGPIIAGHTYTFEWFQGQSTAVGSLLQTNSNVTSSSFINKPSGTYTVRVTDNVSKCSDQKEVTINNQIVPISLTTSRDDNVSCIPAAATGAVHVTSISPVTAGAFPTDYDFMWYNGSLEKASSDYPSNNTSDLLNRTAGFYTVKAIHKTTACVTPAITVQVLNNIIPFGINITTQNPSDCNTSAGRIQALVTPAQAGDVHTFRWFNAGAAVGVPLSVDPLDVITPPNAYEKVKLKTGSYTVEITNGRNGCKQSQTVTLGIVSMQALITIAQTNIDNCIATIGGAIQADLQPSPGYNNTNYDVAVFPGAADPGTPASAGGLILTTASAAAPFSYSKAGFDTTSYYTVVAIALDPPGGAFEGCRASATFKIKRITSDPVIDANATAASIINNINCNTLTGTNTGSGEITVAMGSAITDYDYTWTPTLSNTNNPTGLKPGNYKVRATYNTPVNQGCFTERSFTILNNEQQLNVNIGPAGDLVPTDITNCDASGNMPGNVGSIAFTRINLVGTPTPSPVPPPFTGYIFDWRNEDGTTTINNPNAFSLTNLAPGNYFVTVQNPATQCNLTAGYSIKDNTVNSVGVDLVSFVEPSRCLQPNVFGSLTTLATSTSAYTTTWYNGANDSSPALLPAQVSGTNNERAHTLIAGTYSVKVVNNTTNCKAVQTYTINTQSAIINLVASSILRTFCVDNADNSVIDDGVVQAAVISLVYTSDPSLVPADVFLSNKYNYVWSNVPTGATVTGNRGVHQPAGSYTVQAVDQLDATCVSLPITIEVDEDLTIPSLSTDQIPVTNCDPTIYNGMASVSVGADDDIINYTFHWYEGTPALPLSPPPPGQIYIGPAASDLKPFIAPDNTEYTVLATNRLTGCLKTATFKLDYEPRMDFIPQIEVVSEYTTCFDTVPDGELLASVKDDDSGDYSFLWLGITNRTDITDMRLTSLYPNPKYTVEVTNRETGCAIEANSPIVADPIIPRLQTTVGSASCKENATDQDNGFAAVFIGNSVIQIADITWTDIAGNTLGTGPILSEIPSGTYIVTVTTDLGCSSQAQVTVKTEVQPYNGISRNGDGKNEKFLINCIDSFENNMVKIYNRAGTLVYEAENYNNIDVYFDGRANRGVSMLGNNLPDGTYFYIIDKRDGSKRLAGYLEIVN